MLTGSETYCDMIQTIKSYSWDMEKSILQMTNQQIKRICQPCTVVWQMLCIDLREIINLPKKQSSMQSGSKDQIIQGIIFSRISHSKYVCQRHIKSQYFQKTMRVLQKMSIQFDFNKINYSPSENLIEIKRIDSELKSLRRKKLMLMEIEQVRTMKQFKKRHTNKQQQMEKQKEEQPNADLQKNKQDQQQKTIVIIAEQNQSPIILQNDQ